MMRTLLSYVGIAIGCGLALGVPGLGWACGGLFCDVVPPEPTVGVSPVDQDAELILFDIEGDSICATVQIRYVGEPQAFAWVVPVPEPPEVADGDTDLLDRVVRRTRLQWLYPAPDPCVGGSSGCSMEVSEEDPGFAEFDPIAGPVAVFSRERTESYETAVIGAEHADDLIRWLQTEGYGVAPGMAPAMQPYVDEGMVFLALRLRADRSARSIAPIKFCYHGAAPAIPLRLTAVAARPQMGIHVLVAAHTIFGPLGAEGAAPRATELAYAFSGRVSYFAWVARRAAQAQGKFWSLEFSGPSISGLRGPWLSSWYTRLSPQDMTADPVFVAQPERPAFNGQVDLSALPAVAACFNEPVPERAPPQCAFLYCGVGARCVDHGDQAACVCPEGDVAVPVTSPDGFAQAVCAPEHNPLAIEAGDPCAGFNCGLGTCVNRGGFAACRCDEGTAAFGDPEVGVVCRGRRGYVARGEGSGPETKNPAAPGAGGVDAGAGLLGLTVLALAVRRRKPRLPVA